MKTVAELNELRAANLKTVVLRKGAEALAAAEKADAKYNVLICGGTGCTSSSSTKIADAMKDELVKHGMEKDVNVILTGCFGLCALGPIMIVYPEGAF